MNWRLWLVVGVLLLCVQRGDAAVQAVCSTISPVSKTASCNYTFTMSALLAASAFGAP